MALTFYRASDFDPMLRTMGKVVSVGSGGTLVSTYGMVDCPDVDLLSGAGSTSAGEDISVTIRTGTLGVLLAVGSDIVVDGTTFVVRDINAIGDGALTVISCAVKGT